MLTESCAAQVQTRAPGFMKMTTTDSTWSSLKYSSIGCKAFGNPDEEGMIWFTLNGVAIGDTIYINGGDSYNFAIPQPARWGTLHLRRNTLTIDSTGTGPYIKCLGY